MAHLALLSLALSSPHSDPTKGAPWSEKNVCICIAEQVARSSKQLPVRKKIQESVAGEGAQRCPEEQRICITSSVTRNEQEWAKLNYQLPTYDHNKSPANDSRQINETVCGGRNLAAAGAKTLISISNEWWIDFLILRIVEKNRFLGRIRLCFLKIIENNLSTILGSQNTGIDPPLVQTKIS